MCDLLLYNAQLPIFLPTEQSTHSTQPENHLASKQARIRKKHVHWTHCNV